MNISKETDINKLKPLAYDSPKDSQRAENNIQAIGSRLNQLATPSEEKKPKLPKNTG